MRTHVLLAIFRRNFVSYFSSPIGYVFICAFVLLTAVSAFWPNEFFNRNLANLDTLNDKIPWILLVFIPAITMSIWADERRRGTDELLLTLPATDLEVVLGKYFAALAIYVVSLLFSVSNVIVLAGLGDPDLGLLFANYVGYGLAGGAMLAVGMTASFLTGNLTVGFVLGVVFNAPLVFARYADAIIPADGLARALKGLGLDAQLTDFGRGLITLSGVVYPVAIAVVMLYLCMVFVGRRHWAGQRARRADGSPELVPLGPQFAVRALAVAAIGIGVLVLALRFDARIDLTAERLSTLDDDTKSLIKGLDDERPVFIDAYVSPDVPEAYVQTRLTLLSTLREVDRLGGDAVVVRVNDTERFSDAAVEAEEQFDIRPRSVEAMKGGTFSVEDIHLGLAFQSGLDKVVVPFVDRGIPVRYEVVRSIATVSQQARPRLGVVTTDARLFGGFDMQRMTSRPDQPIIAELRKQYDVIQVDPAQPIEGAFDVLLVVQPSSLPQAPLANLLEAIRSGLPTVIFEDPLPFLDGSTPATSEPRRPPGGNNPFMQQPPPEPKGNIGELWDLLGVRFADRTIIWDDYNPYPKMSEFYPEFVFVAPGSGIDDALAADSAITRDLQQLLFIFAGAIDRREGSPLSFAPLARTGRASGTVPYDQIIQRSLFGAGLNPNRTLTATGTSYTMAARITGTPAADDAPAEAGPIDVVLVADLDVLQSAFFNIRAVGAMDDAPVQFEFDNVPFVLNALDVLAGDERFVPIRSRRPQHRTLTAVEEATAVATRSAKEERERFLAAFDAQRTEAEQALDAEIAALQARTDVDAMELGLEVQMRQQIGRNRLQARIGELERDRDRNLDRLERDLALEIRRVQTTYKVAAVALSPIPPLLIGIVVFLRRRAQERIGVPAARLRAA